MIIELIDFVVNIHKTPVQRCLSLAMTTVFIGLFGRNGAGKTTTLRCIMVMIDPLYGSVNRFDQDVSGLELHRRLGIGYMPGASSTGAPTDCRGEHPSVIRANEGLDNQGSMRLFSILYLSCCR